MNAKLWLVFAALTLGAITAVIWEARREIQHRIDRAAANYQPEPVCHWCEDGADMPCTCLGDCMKPDCPFGRGFHTALYSLLDEEADRG